MSNAPSERFLSSVEGELRKLPPGTQRAVGGGVYMRLDRSGRRRFQYRGRLEGGQAGGTFDSWQEAADALAGIGETALAEALDAAEASREQIRAWTIGRYAQEWWRHVLNLDVLTQQDYRRAALVMTLRPWHQGARLGPCSGMTPETLFLGAIDLAHQLCRGRGQAELGEQAEIVAGVPDLDDLPVRDAEEVDAHVILDLRSGLCVGSGAAPSHGDEIARAYDDFERKARVREGRAKCRRCLLLECGATCDGAAMRMVRLTLSDQLIRDLEVVAAPHRVVKPPNQSFIAIRRDHRLRKRVGSPRRPTPRLAGRLPSG
jgi:hypothetical protein